MSRRLGRLGPNYSAEGIDGVAVEVEGIFLRVLAGKRAAIHPRRVLSLVVVAVFTVENHLLGRVDHLDIAEGVTVTGHLVVIERVAGERVAILGHYERPLVEVGLAGVGVVHAIGGVDGAILRDDGGGGVKHGDMCGRVVEHLLREDVERIVGAKAVQVHIVAEERIFRGRGILPVKRCQVVFGVGEHAANLVIAQVDTQVVIEDIGGEGDVAVNQPHFLPRVGIEHRQSGGIGVGKPVGVNKEGVALLHTHIAVSFDGAGSVVEQGAVAVHKHITAAKLHVAHDYLVFVTVDLLEHIGLFEEHLVGLLAIGRRHSGADGGGVALMHRLLRRGLRPHRHKHHCRRYKQHKMHGPKAQPISPFPLTHFSFLRSHSGCSNSQSIQLSSIRT